MYTRIATYPPEFILLLIKKGKVVILEDRPVRVSSRRLQTYLLGLKCAFCPRTIHHFALESQTRGEGGWHLNPYHVTPIGREIMFTSDHIVPVSRGGYDGIANRQPSCGPCNFAKGNRLPNESEAYTPPKFAKAVQMNTQIWDAKNEVVFPQTDNPKIKSVKRQLITKYRQFEEFASQRKIRAERYFELLGIKQLVNHPERKWDMSIADIINQTKIVSSFLDQLEMEESFDWTPDFNA